jgi:hypothetical protein
MTTISKGKSPFYPGQPVPVELFVGRRSQIGRIVERGVGQVAEGKPVAMFVEGEYGIGKSSIAGVVQAFAEREHRLLTIYASMSVAKTLEDVAASVLEATIRAGAFDQKLSEKIQDWLGKYIGEQSLFGFTIHAENLRKDAPNIASPSGMLPFLKETFERVRADGIRGIFLVLDEINGIASVPAFAHFIKGLIDTNALSREPVPLLLMLCGVEERRREMIQNHQPVDRIFDVIEIERLNETEMTEFFNRAFASVNLGIEPAALAAMIHFSAGFPKIMHLVGDAAYWMDQDGVISEEEAFSALLSAAEEVGRKYVDQQVYAALRSKDYQSILGKIAPSGLALSFNKIDIEKKLTDSEKKKFNNFLQKMKRLNVIRSGEVRGEYIFNVRMVALYIWLTAQRMRETRN